MAIVGTLGFNFQAILPLLARFTFDGGPGAYAALVSAMGVGAVIGALVNGARGKVTPLLLAGAAIGFGALSLLAAGAPTLALELAVLAPLGAASVTLAASVNSALQLASEPSMRGRVMALYSIVFLGSTPIGGPLAGWLAEAIDPRAALVMAGVAAIAAGLLARLAFNRVADASCTATPARLSRRPSGNAPVRRPTANPLAAGLLKSAPSGRAGVRLRGRTWGVCCGSRRREAPFTANAWNL